MRANSKIITTKSILKCLLSSLSLTNMSFKSMGKSKFSFKKYKSSFKRVPTSSAPSSRSPSPTKSTSNSSVQILTSSSDSESDIDERTELEKGLFQLVENGNSLAVKQFLKENRTIDVNKRDTDGCSVLHKAVMNDDVGMVDVLLGEDLDTDINDSLLHAIKENSMQMVLKLLRHKDSVKSRKSIIKKLFPKTNIAFDSSINGEDITPLLMAAISGHYEIIELLYTRGERLAELHFPSCDCSDCGKSSRDLKTSNNRIHLLRGLANSTYIAFLTGVDKSFDPVQKVFQIIADLKRCMKEEPEFRDEYEEILKEIQPFPVEMLSMCRNSSETKIFLRKKSGYTGSSSLPYPRLLLAMDLNQKEFVAHPHAQDILYQDWIGERWTTTNFVESLLRKLVIFIVIVFFPVISVFFWLLQCCCQRFEWIRYVTSPINRFKSTCISYLFFLLVIFYINRTEKGEAENGPPKFYLPWVVGIYVTSHILSYLSHFLINPAYVMDGWNVFDLINHFFFKATITLWIILWKNSQSSTVGGFKFDTSTQHHVLKRNELEAYSPTILAEITLAVASTMAALKPLRAFMLHPDLGPLQVALGKMSKDILKFAVFFAVILFSFGLGTQHLYRPYTTLTTDSGAVVSPNKILGSLTSAIEAFYWAMFTMTDSGSPAVDPIVFKNITNHHFVTESVGKVIFVAFHILAVTFLMNMVTGVMSNTYGRIIENVDIEWKHARSRIWVYFIQDTIVTAPFDIIPNGLFVLNIFSWLPALTRSRQGSASFLPNCCNVELVESEEERKAYDHEYPILIRRLLQRYFRSKNSTASEDFPAKDDIISVHNHVFELKGMTKLTLAKEPSPQPSKQLPPISETDTEYENPLVSTIATGIIGTARASPKSPSIVTLTSRRGDSIPFPNPSSSKPPSATSIRPMISSSQPVEIVETDNDMNKTPSVTISRHVSFPPQGSSNSAASMNKQL